MNARRYPYYEKDQDDEREKHEPDYETFYERPLRSREKNMEFGGAGQQDSRF